MTADVVDSAWLQAHKDGDGLVLLDVRPEADYLAGHLPGARHFDPALLAPQASTPDAVNRFIVQSEWVFSTLGIGPDSRVLVYEQQFDTRAARVAWALEYLGHESVSILEGSLDELRPLLTTQIEPVTRARFRAWPRPELLATAQQIAQAQGDVVVLDTRKQAEYLGLSTGKGRAGRIPGAIHRDYSDNVQAPGRLKESDRLRAELAEAGVPTDARIVTYCGGGGRASHAYYALRKAGYGDVAVYQASWGEWGSRADLPVEADRRVA